MFSVSLVPESPAHQALNGQVWFNLEGSLKVDQTTLKRQVVGRYVHWGGADILEFENIFRTDGFLSP